VDVIEILTAIGTPEGKADPYPLYAELHKLGEVVDTGLGELLVVGYDAINLVLRDPGYRVSDVASFEKNFPGWQANPVFVQAADWILNLNAPRHSQIRSLIARAFTAKRVAGLEPAIAKITDELLETMADRGADGSAVEFMQDFAYMLPVTVICELIGIPESDRDMFRPLARDLVEVFELSDIQKLPAINDAATKLLAYFTELAAKRRAEPRDDLLSDLLAVTDDRGAGPGGRPPGAPRKISDAELMHNLTLLLVAGFETTTNLLGNGLHVILHDSAAAEAARDESVPPSAFVDEVLRYDSPVQLTSRLGYDTTLCGISISAETSLATLLGAGNRDPRRFTEPGRFNPRRAEAGPLSFGGGAHFCIGSALARLEGAVAFPRLIDRFPNITAAGEPTRRETLTLRGFDTLPVTLV